MVNQVNSDALIAALRELIGWEIEEAIKQEQKPFFDTDETVGRARRECLTDLVDYLNKRLPDLNLKPMDGRELTEAYRLDKEIRR